MRFSSAEHHYETQLLINEFHFHVQWSIWLAYHSCWWSVLRECYWNLKLPVVSLLHITDDKKCIYEFPRCCIGGGGQWPTNNHNLPSNLYLNQQNQLSVGNGYRRHATLQINYLLHIIIWINVWPKNSFSEYENRLRNDNASQETSEKEKIGPWESKHEDEKSKNSNVGI